jgi:hypothetical protein
VDPAPLGWGRARATEGAAATLGTAAEEATAGLQVAAEGACGQKITCWSQRKQPSVL